jgi:DNA-binding transcriptional regulator GbsR (MarR family)
MTLPPEFENELAQRFERERKATLELVLKLLESMLNETLRHKGEAFEQEFSKIQAVLDRMQGVLERQMARLDRAAVDRMN